MRIRIQQEPASALGEYARIPIAFEARQVMRVVADPGDGGGFVLSEQKLGTPMLKDYDAIPSNAPVSWPSRFDMSAWMFFAAYENHARVGGAAVVMRSPEIELLEGRDDLVLLWDIRVAPGMRGRGIGSDLLSAVELWAADHGARALNVETQDINVPACRFYARNGFRLRSVNANAYLELPGETQLLWYKEIQPSVTAIR